MRLMVISCCMLLFAACGTPRRFGDADGVPVEFKVHLDRAFVSSMHNRQARVGVGVGGSMSSGGRSSIGTGVGLSFSSTTVYLVGGEEAGGAQVFRKEVKWGDTAFAVPLKAGRTLFLTVQVQGGREGWEAIGSVVIPVADKPTVTVTLSEGGPKLGTTP